MFLCSKLLFFLLIPYILSTISSSPPTTYFPTKQTILTSNTPISKLIVAQPSSLLLLISQTNILVYLKNQYDNNYTLHQNITLLEHITTSGTSRHAKYLTVSTLNNSILVFQKLKNKEYKLIAEKTVEEEIRGVGFCCDKEYDNLIVTLQNFVVKNQWKKKDNNFIGLITTEKGIVSSELFEFPTDNMIVMQMEDGSEKVFTSSTLRYNFVFQEAQLPFSILQTYVSLHTIYTETTPSAEATSTTPPYKSFKKIKHALYHLKLQSPPSLPQQIISADITSKQKLLAILFPSAISIYKTDEDKDIELLEVIPHNQNSSSLPLDIIFRQKTFEFLVVYEDRVVEYLPCDHVFKGCEVCLGRRQCVRCLKGYFMREWECESCSNGCANCEEAKGCLGCDKGFVMTNGQCIYEYDFVFIMFFFFFTGIAAIIVMVRVIAWLKDRWDEKKRGETVPEKEQ